MQRLDGAVVLSATDLVGQTACAHLTTLECEALAGVRTRPLRRDPVLDVLSRRGQEREARFLEAQLSAGRRAGIRSGADGHRSVARDLFGASKVSDPASLCSPRLRAPAFARQASTRRPRRAQLRHRSRARAPLTECGDRRSRGRYAAQGYGSLFGYCTGALRLSEDAACNRIEAARACCRFPVILDLLAGGEMTLTSVRRLGRYLTPENHQAVLEKAKRATRAEIDVLVATLSPRPDARSLVRKLPAATSQVSLPAPQVATSVPPEQAPVPAASAPPLVAARRPVVQPTAPDRYRVQFTIGEATHGKLRRLQALLRREIPNGDPGAIFDRAVTLLLEYVENRKLGITARPRPGAPIRSGTDGELRTPVVRSRHTPRAVRRGVARRDSRQCAFVSPDGRRCTERTFLEFHHVQPYAKDGPATVENISLRCRRHNRYEADLVFGPGRPPDGS